MWPQGIVQPPDAFGEYGTEVRGDELGARKVSEYL